MSDIRVERLADVLVNYSVAVQPGHTVLIQGSPLAAPLLKAIFVRVLEAGGLPMTRIALPGLEELLFRHGSDEQIGYVPEPSRIIYKTFDAIISLMSTTNTKALSQIAPEKITLASRAKSDLFETFTARAAAGELRWVGSLYPTDAYAQDAEMGLSEYEDFVYNACLPDLDDPVGFWVDLSSKQQRIVDWLAGKKTLRVEAEDVSLRMDIAGRRFENCDGKRNMPDGEIFTGPVEDSVEGHVRFSYPTVYQGRRLEGVHLWFERGRVVRATAEKGEAFLLETLDTDPGARYVGEFAIGTNAGITRATGNTLFDEKISGSFHMAVGAGMPETGSVNRSAIHWDMICDMTRGGEIRVDDELMYKDGRFVIGI